MKIAIIGGGAMGAGLAWGLVNGKHVRPEDITVSNPHLEKLEPLRAVGVRTLTDNARCIEGADLIVLAVKPWILPGVVEEIAPEIEPSRQEVSAIVAGVPALTLSQFFADRLPRQLSISMPNTAMSIGQSMTFLVPVKGECRLAQEVFGYLGDAEVIDEAHLPGAMALASCGIAFAMRYVRAACEGGVQLGFRASAAQKIMVQTLKGVAALLEQPGAHPETEIDRVTTPGGKTIRGLNAMEREGFTNAVIAGLLAAAD